MSEARQRDDLAELMARQTLDSRIMRGTAWVAVVTANLLASDDARARPAPGATGVRPRRARVDGARDLRPSGAGTTSALIRRENIRRSVGTALVFLVHHVARALRSVLLVAPFVAALFRARTDRRCAGSRSSSSQELLGRSGRALDLQFRTRALCEVAGGLARCASSIALGFAGYGVWSLVIESARRGDRQRRPHLGRLTLAAQPRLASYSLLKSSLGTAGT